MTLINTVHWHVTLIKVMISVWLSILFNQIYYFKKSKSFFYIENVKQH